MTAALASQLIERDAEIERLEAVIKRLRAELRAWQECICPVGWDRSCPTHVPPIG